MVDGQTDGRTSGRADRLTDGQTDGRVGGRTGGRTDGPTDGRTDRRTGLCVYVNPKTFCFKLLIMGNRHFLCSPFFRHVFQNKIVPTTSFTTIYFSPQKQIPDASLKTFFPTPDWPMCPPTHLPQKHFPKQHKSNFICWRKFFPQHMFPRICFPRNIFCPSNKILLCFPTVFPFPQKKISNTFFPTTIGFREHFFFSKHRSPNIPPQFVSRQLFPKPTTCFPNTCFSKYFFFQQI